MFYEPYIPAERAWSHAPMKSCAGILFHEDESDACVERDDFPESNSFSGFHVPQGLDGVQNNHSERS